MEIHSKQNQLINLIGKNIILDNSSSGMSNFLNQIIYEYFKQAWSIWIFDTQDAYRKLHQLYESNNSKSQLNYVDLNTPIQSVEILKRIHDQLGESNTKTIVLMDCFVDLLEKEDQQFFDLVNLMTKTIRKYNSSIILALNRPIHSKIVEKINIIRRNCQEEIELKIDSGGWSYEKNN